jgi:23S rRNA pseudouridine1911/1915/1917 synthase
VNDRAACNWRNRHDIGAVTGAETTITLVLPADSAGMRLDRALALALPQHSRERLKALVGGGRVTGPNGVLRDPALKVRGGEALALVIPEPRASETIAQDIPLTIVHEDEALLVVDKPAGLVVHPAAGNLDGTMVNALLHHCAGRLSGIGGVARPGIVHRIDKDTSGLLVVAKTDPAHEALSRQFAAHSVDRRYVAVVAGVPVPPAGRIEGALARSTANRQKMAMVAPGRGKHAVTHYRTARALRHAAQIECRLETGRTHQIRVHMASIGHALLGDSVYGRTPGSLADVIKSLGFARQALHAATLGFVHPLSQEKLSFESALPADIVDLISRLSPAAEQES